jgi:hypothetical protein
MDTGLAQYEEQLQAITEVCADPWFAQQLAASRAGDEAAWRRISGSCLGRVLEIAKQLWHPGSPLDVLDLAQEGNRVLVRTIKQFRGSTAEEFLRELSAQVERRLALLAGQSETHDALRGA